MLHTCLFKCDAGLNKKVLEAQKSFKIELRGAENPSKKQLWSDSATEDALEHHFFRIFAIFWWFLDSKMHLKFEKKLFKFDASKQHVFGFEFWTDFLRLGLWKRRRNRAICVFLSKTQILQIIDNVFPWENHYFSSSEPRKIYENWMLKRNEK